MDNAIIQLQKQLNKVRNTRQLHRNARKRVPYPIVALVGYTNAGKSTLFNKLTKSRNAIVSDFSGLTKDRNYGLLSMGDSKTFLIDSGGIDSSKKRI